MWSRKRDRQAIGLLNSILLANSSSRNAKLELAQIFGYRENYRESDRLYRELLATDPNDETAALGLVHNLSLEGKRAEARAELQQAFTRHPTSLQLQQYSDYLASQLCRSASRGNSIAYKTLNRSSQILQETVRFIPAREWSINSARTSPAAWAWMKHRYGRPAPLLRRCFPARPILACG